MLEDALPHEVSDVSWGDVALSRTIEPLESGVRLEGLSFAKVLSAKLYFLLTFSRVSEELGQFLLGRNRDVLPLHF